MEQKVERKGKLLFAIIGVGIIVILAVIIGVIALGGSDNRKLQEQLDLGAKYLDEMDYEQALVAYQAALEIDPKNADAYLGIVNAYIGMNDFENVLKYAKEGYEVTKDERLKEWAESEQLVGTEEKAEQVEPEEAVTKITSLTLEKKRTDFDDGVISRWDEYEYDAAGNLTKMQYYNADGSPDGWMEPEYDAAENRTKEQYYYGDGSPHGWYEYEYDAAGNLTKEQYYDAVGWTDGWTEYEYDAAGNRTKSQYYNADGSPYGWTEYEYDAAVNLTKVQRYNADGSKSSWGEYEYDAAGNLTKVQYYYADGSPDGWGEYEYDAGNLEKTLYYDSAGQITREIEYITIYVEE